MSKKMIISLLVLSFASLLHHTISNCGFHPSPLSDAINATDRPVVYADDRAEHVEGRAAIVSPRAPTGEAAQSNSGDVAAPLAAGEAAKNEAIARAEAQLDDRQHSARQRMAQLVTADLERGRREEADRIVVELEATLRATDDAAAAQRARLAQLEVEKRARAAAAEKLAAEEAAKNAAIARAEAQLDDRQHSARQRMAQLVTADLERGRREEADRIVVELETTLRAADDVAAAERARFAQLEVEKRARAAATEKLAAEEAAKNAAIARAEAQLDDRQHSARQRMAQLVTADLERGRREEADRIVVELEATLRATDDAAAAQRARLAQLEVETRARAAAAEKLAAEEAAKNAAIAGPRRNWTIASTRPAREWLSW